MRAVTIDSDLATLFTFTPRKPPITPIEGVDPIGKDFCPPPAMEAFLRVAASSLLAARLWPAIRESRLLGVFRGPAPGFRPRRLSSGTLVTRCSTLSFKRRPDTTPLVGRHDQAGRHLS